MKASTEDRLKELSMEVDRLGEYAGNIAKANSDSVAFMHSKINRAITIAQIALAINAVTMVAALTITIIMRLL